MADVLKYLFVSEKKWHDTLFYELQGKSGSIWIRCSSKEEFTVDYLDKLQPDLIFLPHWSYIIPNEIYSRFECILFHMTNLPYGRGGSPLQNLIVRGHKETFISAIRVAEGIDKGPIYLKAPLNLEGTAEDIFIRAASVIKKMIIEIINTRPIPVKQTGKPVLFKRRKPEESNIATLNNTAKIYDYIRMLDANGYPKAFLETEHFRFEFSKASFENNDTINANVRIIKK
ncbi:MAG: formyltransferase family protein [Bacteroidia bacterium]